MPLYLGEKKAIRKAPGKTLLVEDALHSNHHGILEALCNRHQHHGHHPGSDDDGAGLSGGSQPQGFIPGTLLQFVINSEEVDQKKKSRPWPRKIS